MSSLWTPEGEHRVEREPSTAPKPSDSEPPAGGGDDGAETEDDAQLRAEFEELENELLSAPVEDVIANHCYGLFQLAALHLGQQPPNLDKARLAIDAFAAIVDALGPRLGSHAETFSQGLAQIRIAYVQLHATAEGGPVAPTNGHAPESGAPTG